MNIFNHSWDGNPNKKPPKQPASRNGGEKQPAFARLLLNKAILAEAQRESDSAMMIACAHADKKKHGKDRHGNQRFRCLHCGKTWVEVQPKKPLGAMLVDVEDAKRVLMLLAEGSSIRSAERISRIHRDTICKLLVYFGDACRRFLDGRMRGLTLSHLQFDESNGLSLRKSRAG